MTATSQILNKAFFIIFILSSSCVRNNSYEVENISSGEEKYRSFRMRFPDSKYKEVELEILFLSNNTKCFLNFYRNAVENSQDRLVKISTDNESFEETCFCLKGNQRILLTEKLTKLLIDHLKDGKKISIIHNKSIITIDGKKFTEAYENSIVNRSFISSFFNTIK